MNVTEFKPIIIAGGKPEGPYNGHNWLKKLTPGTVFLFRLRAKANFNDVGIQQARVIHHYDYATQLFDDLNQPVYYIVDTVDYSTVMKCVQVLYVPPLTEETSNEEQDRVQQGQVGDVQEPTQ